jgi:hypothetical protein
VDRTDGRDLTLEQAAARLGISREAARKRAERGSFLGAVKLMGAGWSIPADALERPVVSRPDSRPSRSVRPLDDAVLSELRAIRLALTDGRAGPRPGRPAPWWRWLLFGQVRAKGPPSTP